jgi:diguanylate cyclase (GGDEF)-like protein/PAS domain S-box-containing protein
MAEGEGRRTFDERDAAKVLQGLPDGLVVLEQDATIVWVNARFRALTGWPDGELVGRNGLELLDPAQLADAFEAFTITTEQEMLPEGTYSLAHREGGFVDYQLHAATVDPSQPDSLVALLVRPVDYKDMINDGIERLNAGGPISDMADFVVHRIGWDAGQVAVAFDDDIDGTRRSVNTGLHEVLDGTRSAEDGLAPWDEAVASGGAVHRHVDELPASIAAAARAQGFGACTAEPVPDASGRDAVILLWFDAEAPATYRFLFHQEPRYLLLRLALERRHHLRALRNAATNDHLTGLANRHHFFDAIDRISADAPCAVLYIDLDDFKPINDNLGHLMGDAVLREIGMRLRESVRTGDVAARLGGDEFAILCCEDATEDAVGALAARVHAAITRPIEMPGGAVRVGASVGGAVAAKPGIPATLLIEAADRALYEHKRLGKDGWRTILVT